MGRDVDGEISRYKLWEKYSHIYVHENFPVCIYTIYILYMRKMRKRENSLGILYTRKSICVYSVRLTWVKAKIDKYFEPTEYVLWTVSTNLRNTHTHRNTHMHAQTQTKNTQKSPIELSAKALPWNQSNVHFGRSTAKIRLC